MEQMHKK